MKKTRNINMAAVMVSDRGLRKKITQEVVREEIKSPKKAAKRKAPTPKSKDATENNNNTAKKPKIIPNGDTKEDLFDVYQPWVINAYGDLAKTKTITLRKYARILKTLKGEDVHSSDSSKFRFWVKAKGFHLGQPQGYEAKPADGIVCRYSVLDVDGGQEKIDLCSGSAEDPALYVPTAPVKNSPFKETVYRKVAIVENFFDIIYTVHVDLEGRSGKHAGQKRTYRTITETYAFLPREAVTRFLMGCTACQRRPRSPTPPSLPTPSPSPSPVSSLINGCHQTSPKITKSDENSNRNWDVNDVKISKSTSIETAPFRPFLPVNESSETCQDDILVPKKLHVNGSYQTDFQKSAFYPVQDINKSRNFITTDVGEVINNYQSKNKEDAISHNEKANEKEHDVLNDVDSKSFKEEDKLKDGEKDVSVKVKKPYNPLDVCNLTSKDCSPGKNSVKLLPNSSSIVANERWNCDPAVKSFSRPWSPVEKDSSEDVKPEVTGGHLMFNDTNIDYTVPITTTYLKHMQKLGYSHNYLINKDSLGAETTDITEDEHMPGLQLKDADKLKLLLLAWDMQNQKKARNGEVSDVGTATAGVGTETNVADLWASYHTALGLAGAGAAGVPSARRSSDQPSPILLGTNLEGPGNHDETSSSAGNGKEDEDTLASDDESDDRMELQHYDPERLKAFNMFVRLFVDENLDRMVPISKQPKEKIQAIIDSCTRQFPEFAERARKRIRTYLKSCRRNKKVRGEGGSNGNGTPTWDSTIRPTPAHLTSVQAEQILAQACENESHNAKRMRLGLEPISQPMPTSGTNITTDTTPPTTAHPLLSVYSTPPGSINTASTPGNSASLLSKPSAQSPNTGANVNPALITAHLNGGCHNNNNNKMDIGNKNNSSRTSTPSASGSVTDFSTSLGVTPTSSALHNFGHASLTGPQSANALLSTLGAVAGLHNAAGNTSNSSATNAAVAAYQNALFSAAMAHQGPGLNFGGLGVALAGNGPTDLSMKNSSLSSSFPSLSSATAASVLGLNPIASTISHTGQNSTKPVMMSHKLNTAEMTAVRQLITGYRESAAFLLRSADELETLLLHQP